jgi:flagellar motility protein MotE (MotC chaperone)
LKLLLLFTLLTSTLFSLQTSDRLFECTEIFKERKSELLVELERIDEQKQALSALKVATEELLKQKGSKLTLKEEQVDEKLAIIMEKEKSIKGMMQRNEAALKELKSTKMSKIAQTFSKMKASSASAILSEMEAKDATMILRSLKPKVVGKIFTKMGTKKASELTQLLSE